ncbi:MAG: glycosyltransferase [Candidatus Aenigmarchaeota archaeon]|nr:glycosyltransferase [Candidatus Aenigmarchaeota archaeon]
MIGVAHFRRALFRPTETFIYNYLTSFRQTLPICFAHKRINDDRFPYTNPVIEIYKWNKLSKYFQITRHFFLKSFTDRYPRLKFDTSLTLKKIREYDVKVLHAHFGYSGPEVLPIKRKTNLPLVTTFYGQDVSEMAEMERWKKAYAQLFREGDLFLVEGPHMRNRLLEIGCPYEKTHIQRIALRIDNYPFRYRIPKGRDENIKILFCGTFGEKKGLLFALDAVRRARARFNNLEFRIIGDGLLRPQVEQFINQYKMQNYTELLGFQAHQAMIEEMNSADIFIHPSVTAANNDSEGGAPTTILEAQACGLPILSTSHADIPNVVVPEKSALLSPERDTDSLEKNLITLLNEQERWAEMGQIGRQFIEKYHDITEEVTGLERLYFKLSNHQHPVFDDEK